MNIAANAQIIYIMLALPALFGMTLVGEGVYKMVHYEHGWLNVMMGVVFLGVVAFGYFYMLGIMK
jgi:hypothetical protein